MHQKIGWLLALEYTIDIAGRAPVLVNKIGPIGDEGAAGKRRCEKLIDQAVDSEIQKPEPRLGESEIPDSRPVVDRSMVRNWRRPEGSDLSRRLRPHLASIATKISRCNN
jgi:hypothetical protein